MMLTDLADTLRGAGLRVVEIGGWQTRGHGPMVAVRTIVCHHTGSKGTGSNDYPSLRTVRDGRDLGTPTELAGPLAQLGLGVSGTWYTVAAGRAWHAGVVLRPDYGNSYAVGIEAQGDGVSPWPAVQYDSYAIGCAALARRYGLPVDRVLGHKEVCSPPGRKPDPNFDMAAFRRLVTTYLEDDMPLDDTDIAKILNSKIDAAYTDAAGDRIGLGDAVGLAQRWALHGALRTQQLEAQLTALDAKVSQLAVPPAASVDVAALAAAIAPLLPAAPTAEQVADLLAARLQQ